MKSFKLKFIIVSFAAAALGFEAHACPSGWIRDSVLKVCLPKCGGFICDTLDEAWNQGQVATLAAPLSEWIRQSRNDIRPDAERVPDHIRQQLLDYVDVATIDSTRYVVGEWGALNLGYLTLEFGGMDAIALEDTIVFKHEEDALYNVELWAHELYHVAQFREWGLDGFARRYSYDADIVERDARKFAAAFEEWKVNYSRPRPSRILENYVRDGDFIWLKCEGHIPGNRILDGNTYNGEVYLSPTWDGKYIGTRWTVHVNDDGTFSLFNQDFSDKWLAGNQNRMWLSGYDGRLRLAFYDHPSSRDGDVAIRVSGTEYWLDGGTEKGTIRLSSSTDMIHTGTEWTLYN